MDIENLPEVHSESVAPGMEVKHFVVNTDGTRTEVPAPDAPEVFVQREDGEVASEYVEQ